MIGMLLSFILFVISIPVKTIHLGLKVTNKTLDKKEGNGKSRLRDKLRLSNRGSKDKSGSNKKPSKMQKALKVAEKVVKALAIFLKTLSVVIGLLGFFISILLLFFLLIVIGGVAGFIIMSGDLGIDLGSLGLGGGGIGSEGRLDTSEGYIGVESDGNVVNAITTMADFYINQIGYYSHDARPECSLLGTGTVRPDCSGFGQAVVRYLNGEKNITADSSNIPLGYSGDFIPAGCTWANELQASGWVRLDPTNMEITDLQPGDMLIRPGHVSFYMGVNQIFGWGEAKTKCPYGAKIGKYGSYFGIGSQHDYKVVYRFTGNSNTQPSVTEGE